MASPQAAEVTVTVVDERVRIAVEILAVTGPDTLLHRRASEFLLEVLDGWAAEPGDE